MSENQSIKKAPIFRAKISHDAFEAIQSGEAEAFELPRNKTAEKTAFRFSVVQAVRHYLKGRLEEPHFHAEFTDTKTGEVLHCLLDYSYKVQDPETGEDVFLFPFVSVEDRILTRPVAAVRANTRCRKED